MTIASSVPGRRIHIVIPLALPVLLAACSPHRAPQADTMRSRTAPDATVFTDSALYRQVCAEADSGLTRASGRCTPRDQGVHIARPLPPPRP